MSTPTPSLDAQIELDHVSKWYDRQTRRRLRTAWPGRPPAAPRVDDIVALWDVDLTIDPGEVLGIIGNNGAGKTTLLRLIAGVTAPSTGQVKVRGAVASMIELGLGFHPHLTGAENLAYSAQVLGMSSATVRRRWDEIVEFSGVEHALHQPVRQYSTGMLARLGFSLAAHSDAPVILVDEVLAVGDYAFQRQSLDRLRTLASEGRTLVIVTHNLPSVVDVCTRVAELVDGVVTSVGRPESVVAGYVASQVDAEGNADQLGIHLGEVSVTPSEIDVGDPVTVRTTVTVDQAQERSTVALRIGIGSALYGGPDRGQESMERLVDQPVSVPLDRPGSWEVQVTMDEFPLYAAEYGIGFTVVRDEWDEVLRRLVPLSVHGDRDRRQLRVAMRESITQVPRPTHREETP